MMNFIRLRLKPAVDVQFDVLRLVCRAYARLHSLQLSIQGDLGLCAEPK